MKLLIGLSLLASCTPTSFTFSPTTNGITSKASGCPVEAMTSPPDRDFQEVGTLDFYNGTEPKTLGEFKKDVAQRVCEVGGDAVIAIADSKGLFTKGTVIAYIGYGAPSKGKKIALPPMQQHDNEVPK